jgi:MFS family permease
MNTMEKRISLKQMEKHSAAAIFQTGLIEIGISLVFIVSSLAMIFDDYRYYIDILFIVPIIFMYLSVRYIAQPRMGVVKVAKRRARKSRWMIMAITSFLVIMVLLTVFGKSNSLEDIFNPRWIITGIIFFICIVIGYFLSYDRMYLYAFLLAGAFNLSEVIRENPGVISEGGYAYLLASIVLLCIGCVYLYRFIKMNPLS